MNKHNKNSTNKISIMKNTFKKYKRFLIRK